MNTIRAAAALFTGLLIYLPNTSVAQSDRDCSDFSSWQEAQEFYEENGPGDPHGLDADNDGIACESLD